jgi:AcrR family transcriptional regulator
VTRTADAPSPKSRTAKTAPAKRSNIDRSASTRELVLKAVVRILHDHGFAALTNAGICEAAGVSSGAMMYHFPTRQALLVETVKYAYNKLTELREAMLQKMHPGLPRFRAIIDLSWATARMPEGIAVNEVRIGARSDADLARAMQPVLTEIATVYGRWVGQYTREAGLTSTVEIQSLSAMTAMSLRSLAIDRFTYPSPQMVANILLGLRTMRENIIAQQRGDDRRIDPSLPNSPL